MGLDKVQMKIIMRGQIVLTKFYLSKFLWRPVWFCQHTLNISTESKYWKVSKYFNNLRNDDSRYCALKVWQCNGGGGYGVPFKEAFIRVGPERHAIKKGYAEAWKSTRSKIKGTSVFGPALESLEHYDEHQDRNGLRGKLIGEAVNCFKEFDETLDKTFEEQAKLGGIMLSEKYKYNIQAIVAAHIFSHLVPLPKGSQRCRLDGQQYPGINYLCPCGCGQNLNLGYTGYGNKDAWYGFADMVVDKCTVSVELDSPDEYDDFDDCTYEEDNSLEKEFNFQSGMTSEVNKKTVPKNINRSQVFSQFMAQTITNAFYQTNVDPGLGEFLIPSFLVTTTSVYICMYCVEHDLLLFRWPPLSLWNKNLRFNKETMFEVWMALNFDRLNSPVSDHLIRLTSKFGLTSDFPKVIEKHAPSALYNFKEASSPIKEGSGNLHQWGDLDLLGSVEEGEQPCMVF